MKVENSPPLGEGRAREEGLLPGLAVVGGFEGFA